jgi:hypothetical protein
MDYFIILIKILQIDFDITHLRKQISHMMFKYYKIMRRLKYMFTPVNILKYIIIKSNHIIKTYYYILLGEKIIYFLLFILFFYNDIYIQTFLAICIFLDTCYKHVRAKNKIKSENLLTPSLNIYYPISFSIFSVTIRITGAFLTLLLGV